MPIDKKILEDYVATANSGKYATLEEVNAKFPELKGYDPKLLEDYVATANSGKYNSIDEVNAKFPEFDSDLKKKANPWDISQKPLENGGVPSSEGSQLPLTSPSISMPTTTTPTWSKEEVEQIRKANPVGKINLYSGTLNQVNKRIEEYYPLYQQAEQSGDKEAMDKLIPILQEDLNKSKLLQKAIEDQKKLAILSTEEPDNLSNSFNIGMYNAIGTIMLAPKTIDRVAMQIAAKVTGVPDKVVNDYMEYVYPKTNVLSDKIAAAGKFVIDKSSERSQQQKIARQYEGSAFKALKEGDISSAAKYAVNGFAESIPGSLTFMNPAGAALTSVGMVGQEVADTEAKGKEVTMNTIIAGSAKAALETITERMFGAGAASKELLKSLGKEGIKEFANQTMIKAAEKSLGRKLLQTEAEEVIGEAANQWGSNLVDIYLNGDKKSQFEGVGDAALIALVGGSTQGSVATTAQHYIDKAAFEKVQQLRDKASAIMDESLHQESPIAAQALENHAEQINNEADAIQQENQSIIDNAKPATIEEIENIFTEKDKLLTSLETLSEDARPVIENEIAALDEHHQALIEQAKSEAKENIEQLDKAKQYGFDNANDALLFYNENNPNGDIKYNILDVNDSDFIEARANKDKKIKEEPNNAIQERQTEKNVSRIGEGGQNQSESSEGVRPIEQGKEIATESKTQEKVEPKDGDLVHLPPVREGGLKREFVFKDGEWQQKVGSKETSKIGDKQQKEIQAEYDKRHVKEGTKEAPSVTGTKVKAELANNDGTQVDKGEAKEKVKGTKVSDKEGNPVVVYHGSGRTGKNAGIIEHFDEKMVSKNEIDFPVNGFFFAGRKAEAEIYGGEENVGSYYVDIKNPASEKDVEQAIKEARNHPDYNKEAGEYHNPTLVRKILIEKGYDGYIPIPFGKPNLTKLENGDVVKFDGKYFKYDKQKNEVLEFDNRINAERLTSSDALDIMSLDDFKNLYSEKGVFVAFKPEQIHIVKEEPINKNKNETSNEKNGEKSSSQESNVKNGILNEGQNGRQEANQKDENVKKGEAVKVSPKDVEAFKEIIKASEKKSSVNKKALVEKAVEIADNKDKVKFIADNFEEIKRQLMEKELIKTDCKW